MLEIKNWTVQCLTENETTLENINLNFDNKVTAIIGKSGVGKTTFINSLTINKTIINGQLKWQNKEIDFKKDKKWFRKNIGIISQKNILIDSITVFDNLKITMSEKNNFFFNLFNIITKKQKEEILNILEQVEMLDKVNNLPLNLSGGEIQRLEIAKILIKKPKIILSDEPTSNLDDLSSEKIIKLLIDYSHANNAVTIVNIHNVNLLNLFDRVIGLKNKKIVFDSNIKKINKKEILNIYEN